MDQISSLLSSTSSFRPSCVICIETNKITPCNHPRCTFCDKRLETCELFVEHREALHPKCELCNKVFKNKELFDAHYVSCKEKMCRNN